MQLPSRRLTKNKDHQTRRSTNLRGHRRVELDAGSSLHQRTEPLHRCKDCGLCIDGGGEHRPEMHTPILPCSENEEEDNELEEEGNLNQARLDISFKDHSGGRAEKKTKEV